MPPGTVGLRRWTVLLPSRGDVADVRARAQAAGLLTESVNGGFLTRDPWDNAVLLTHAGGA